MSLPSQKVWEEPNHCTPLTAQSCKGPNSISLHSSVSPESHSMTSVLNRQAGFVIIPTTWPDSSRSGCLTVSPTHFLIIHPPNFFTPVNLGATYVLSCHHTHQQKGL